MDINKLYNIFLKNREISINTKDIKKGCIFFGLRGNNVNGGIFAKEAIKKGASIAIVDDIKYESVDSNIIYVNDALKTLQDLALEHRKNLSIPIIAVTGTNGKTTSKELISEVLSIKYKTFKTEGNLNNHIGVPLSILSIKDNIEIAVIEMGASKLGDIKELCNIVLPNFGYITNFGKAHLEEFLSIENIIKTKTELYDFIKNNEGILFVNNNDSIQVEKSKKSKIYSFGNKGDIKCKFISSEPYLNIDIEGEEFKTKMIGDYNFYNIISAYTIGKYFNISKKKMINILSNYKPSNNRTQVIKKENSTIIMDCYNANPSSIKYAVDNISNNMKSNNNILILGDMLELGIFSDIEHKEILNYISTLNNINKVYLVGKEFYKQKNNKFDFFENFESFIKEFTFSDNSNYLVKGSRGIKLERILDYI